MCHIEVMKHAAHNHRFEVVWKGQWFWLASLSEHIRGGVSPTGPVRLLLDKLYRKHLAPFAEIHIPDRPLS